MPNASLQHQVSPERGERELREPGTGSQPGDNRNVALLIAYNGSRFQGWQVQPHGPSVQGTLEDSLRILARREVRLYASGRTDTGVHACNQVANAHLPAEMDLAKLRSGLNGLSGPGISVKGAVHVPNHFNARHRAIGKIYRYRIFNHPYPPVFGRDRVWWIRMPLDIEAMRAGAENLVGTHDFSAFRAAHCSAPNPVRSLRKLEVSPSGDAEGILHIEFEASGFLQHMARIITGTLVGVGMGKLPPRKLGEILAGRRREDASATAPGAGLHLMRVEYDLEVYPQLREFSQGS